MSSNHAHSKAVPYVPGPCLPVAPWLLCIGVVEDAAGGGESLKDNSADAQEHPAYGQWAGGIIKHHGLAVYVFWHTGTIMLTVLCSILLTRGLSAIA